MNEENTIEYSIRKGLARDENNPARNLYKRMGLIEEGRFEKRIKGVARCF